jgi:hypothetical protein
MYYRDCNAGYYKSGTSCLACPTGKYSGAAATVCALCTLKPSANTYYIGRADGQPSTSDACPWCACFLIRLNQRGNC